MFFLCCIYCLILSPFKFSFGGIYGILKEPLDEGERGK